MSTLNLKQYLAKIDTLLEDEYYDEAIFHSRHVLSLLPKNLATYRRLGRAEVGAGRWQEANTTLRRILSFAPDDKIAHMGMSKVYQRAKKGDEALWHLERAYEQDPNNQAIIDELRDLYQAYKNISNVRLQLTAGAVGRQYAKNQLYPQAIQVLKNALKQTPQRVDLRLMLARVYREAGDVVAAAETALDVLDVLPDCLDANYIMTEVWLSEQRPSDAQRYLSVVEALDPYLAIRLAQGHPAPDDLIELPQADYKKAAQTISDQKPDWLSQIDDGNNPVVSLDEGNWQSETVNDPTLKLSDSQILDLDLGDDDLSWLDEPTSPVTQEETHIPENTRKRTGTGLTGMLNMFDDNQTEEEQHNVPTEQINLDDLFNNTDDEEVTADDEVIAWLTDTPKKVSSEADKDAVHANDSSDPLAWLKESGIELHDAPLSEEMMNLTKAPTQALDPNDPMNWLHASGIELTDENPEDIFTPYEKIDSTTLKANDDDDPMAWMRDSGVELVDDEPIQNFFEEEDVMHASDSSDPLAWLHGSGIELVEDEQPSTPTPVASTDAPSWGDDSSFLDEMLSMEELTGGTDSLASKTASTTAPNEDWQDTMFDNSDDKFPDWLSDSQPTGDDDFSFDTPQEDETPDWLMDAKPTEAKFDPDATNINFDFGELSADDEETEEDETPDWLMDAKPTEAKFDPDATNINFDFGELSADDEETEEDETPDWLMDMKPTETSVAEDEFDFLSDNFGVVSDETPEDDETPDWLSGVTTPVAETASDDDFAFAELDETPEDDETPDWLSGVTTPVAETASDDDFAFAELDETPEDDETPDWLSGVTTPVAETSSDDDFAFAELDETPEEDETPDWLSGVSTPVAETSSDDDFAFAELDETPEDDETPDWLSGVSTPVAETASDDDFAFAGLDETPEEDETPDWLSGVTTPVAETASDDDFAFAGLDETPEDDETPDWLSGVSTPVAETASDDDFAFAELDETPEEDETPDWLSGVSIPVAETSSDDDFTFAELDETPEEDETPDWLSGVSTPVAETSSDDDFAFTELDETPEDDETPDWLMGMSDDEEISEETEDLSFAELDLDETPTEEEAPDWLMSMKPTEAVAETTEAEFDFLSDDLGDEELVTEDAPDWLMESRPQEETDRALDWLAEDETPVEEETPSWLSSLDDEEETTLPEEITTEFDETVPVMAETGGLGLSDEVQSLHTPAENAPDWLNALVPGLDIDYDAEEDAQIEQSFLSDEAITAASAQFAWLNKIVDSEVNQPPMTMPSASTIVKPEASTPVTTTPAPRRSWLFTRPPAWMSKAQPQSTGIKPISSTQPSTSTPQSSEFDDLDDLDDEDDDLPDWLRDDNDDEPDFLRDNF